MTEELKIKYEDLKNYFKSLGSVAIAFSSGVDSTLMLKVAHDVLGDKAVAVTARSHSFPVREINEATDFCKKEGIEHYQDALNWTPREDSLEGFIHINGDTFYSNTIFYYTSQVVEYDKNYLEQKPFFNLADMDTDRWTLESFLKGMAEGDKEVYNYLQSILSTQDTDAKNYTK